jgi:hypothetical protein
MLLDLVLFCLALGFAGIGAVNPGTAPLWFILAGLFVLLAIGGALREWRRGRRYPSATNDSRGSPMFEAGRRARVHFDDVIATGYEGPKLAEESEFTARRSRFERHATPGRPSAESRMPSSQPGVRAQDEGGSATVDREPVGIDDGPSPRIDTHSES